MKRNFISIYQHETIKNSIPLIAELWTVSQQLFTIGNLGSTAAGATAL
jgi:hypothetical protein